MATPILTLRGVGAGFGQPPLFEKLDVNVGPGERIALVGRNGSGKSTLLKIFAGHVSGEDGERFLRPGTSIAYLGQDVSLEHHGRVGEFVDGELRSANLDGPHLAEAALSEVGLSYHTPTEGLSGGERRKVAIAAVLARDPDLLLLDEPTNHLDIPAIEWLEQRLGQFSGAVITVSHDRAFLKHLSRVTLWLDRGKIYRLNKGYEHFEAWSEDLLANEAEETAKLDKLIAEETRWSREGITARRKRNQGRLRRLYSLREERQTQRAIRSLSPLEAETERKSGKLVAEVRDISISFGDKKLIEAYSGRVVRGDRIGIIGPNGAGKTTLLKILIGDLTPDQGTVRVGTNLDILVFDQNRDQLDPEATLWDTLCDTGGDHINVRGVSRHVIGYLKDFLFLPAQARSPVKSLSGGEKNRLLLAKHLARSSNLLILDEPTNDLDLETLDLLQEMLADYEGTILLVSHDRDFLDRVVTSTIVVEGNGRVQEYAGGYSDYLLQCNSVNSVESVKKVQKSTQKSEKRRKNNSSRMSFKDKHELENLPGVMSELEEKMKILTSALNEAGSDGEKIRELSDQLGRVSLEHAQAEERWLELEMLREEIEG